MLAHIIHKITGRTPLLEQILPPTNCHPVPDHPDDITDPINKADITWHTTTGPIHLDVMVTSALTTHALAGAHATSITPGLANTIGEQYKKRKYAPHPIIPILFEAHGRIGNDTLTFSSKFCRTLPETEQQPMYHYALQALSTTLQRCNANTINTHLTHHLQPHQPQAIQTPKP